MYNYVVTAQKPTNVTHSVVGNFTGPAELNLIIAKCTRVEIFLLTPEGLSPVMEFPIYGRIAVMELYRPQSETQDLLFISTERYKFCVLAFDSKSGEISTRAQGDVQDRIGRLADAGPIGIIDPEKRVIGLHLYDGLFKVVPIDGKGQLREAFNIRLEELQVIDIKFLYGCAKPTIAVLFQDTKESRHVKTYEVSLKDAEFTDGPWNQPNVETGASLLIPIPAPLGGCVFVGEQTITYHAGSYFKSVHVKPTVFKTYGLVDADGSRLLLGDHVGNLYVLLLIHDDKNVTNLTLECLGQTSIASTLSYLDNGVVFVGSSFGDSQLIKLNPEKDESGFYLEVLETYTNLGPITDFCVVDLDRQGQGQVVTCSGAFKDGSLRIIRNGIGINEQATIDLAGIKGMWSLRASFAAPHDKYLVLAFIAETRIYAMDGEELGESEIAGFTSAVAPLFCGNVVGDHWIQVTEQSVRLVSCGTQQLVQEWKPPAGMSINVATANSTQVALATGGGNLVYIDIVGDQLVQVSHLTLEHEISCLNVNPVGEAAGGRSAYVAVGMWTDITLRVYSLPNLTLLAKEPLAGEIIPRSVLFASFEGVHYLLCALGDGHLFNFVFDPTTGTLHDRKKISLGTQPMLLSTFRSKNATHVFAASDRPTVIYSSNKKLLYSNVNLKEVNHMCAFNSEGFPDSLAMATESALTLGTIDDIQKLHIRSVYLHEQPRRIAHHEASRTFGVCTVKAIHDPLSADDIEQSFLRLIDEQTFEVRHCFQMESYELAISIISTEFADDATSYLVVGTAFALPDESEPHRGRILVFNVVDSKLVLVAEKETKGAVYCLAAFNGKIVAGINSRIQVFRWRDGEDGSKDLDTECSHHGHVLSLYIQTRGDFIVVGDLMRSISLLLYKSMDQTLEEIARDFNAAWMTAIDVFDYDTFLGAENSFNLFTLRRNSDAATDEERQRLDVVGEYHLGEFVNRFRHGSLVMRLPESEGPVVPTLIYCTVNGVIGVIATLPQDQFQFLVRVQHALTRVIKGVGGFSHDQWRSFQSERRTAEAKNFLDGDLIETFLDLKRPKAEEVAAIVGVSVDELSKRIEELQRLH